MGKRRRRLSAFQTIILCFGGTILLGALLLMLPIASRSGTVTPFGDTLFTATSAVCVTGLIVRDTATHWSAFGQVLILLLIQIGGLGVITVAASFAILSGRKIGLWQRSTMQEAIAAQKLGGVVRLTGFILRMTFAIELLGAICMLPSFCSRFGLRGVWMAVFHAISAFCNAGFDLLGTPEAKYVSLTVLSDNAVIQTVVMLLIVAGGLGFLTWDDLLTHKFRVRRYRMQSKVILVTSLLLILVPALLFLCRDFAALPTKERILASLFQSVTARTAGFNSQDLNTMTDVGRAVMIVLMLIGGSPGSTAGGMKTTTAAVLFASAAAAFRRRNDAQFFGRRIDHTAVRNAAVILVLYLAMFFGGAIVISAVEGLPLGVCLYETASAVGTVGLTLGITPSLGTLSRLILMALMFFGRVGGLTLIYAAISEKRNDLSRLPQETITVG